MRELWDGAAGVGVACPHGVKALPLSFWVGDFGGDEARLALAGAEDEEDLSCAVVRVKERHNPLWADRVRSGQLVRVSPSTGLVCACDPDWEV